MSIIPSIDFNNYSDSNIPPNYRLPKFMIWMRSLVFMWFYRWNLFKWYMAGSDIVPFWSSTTTYNVGDTAKSYNGVYESLVAGNINNALTNTTYWNLVLSSPIGATERAQYNGRYLNLTYQLNRYFQQQLTANGFIGFRQPPYPAPYGGSGTFSDIYITNVPPVFSSFVSFTTETLTSDVFTIRTGQSASFTTTVTETETSYQYAINIPIAVYNSLGATNAIRNSVIRSFADNYTISGCIYQIITY